MSLRGFGLTLLHYHRLKYYSTRRLVCQGFFYFRSNFLQIKLSSKLTLKEADILYQMSASNLPISLSQT